MRTWEEHLSEVDANAARPFRSPPRAGFAQNTALQIETTHPLILESRHAWPISMSARSRYDCPGIVISLCSDVTSAGRCAGPGRSSNVHSPLVALATIYSSPGRSRFLGAFGLLDDSGRPANRAASGRARFSEAMKNGSLFATRNPTLSASLMSRVSQSPEPASARAACA
jgi:hypothetical protein